MRLHIFLWGGIAGLFVGVDSYFTEPRIPATIATDVSYILVAGWFFWLARKAKIELSKKAPAASANI